MILSKYDKNFLFKLEKIEKRKARKSTWKYGMIRCIYIGDKIYEFHSNGKNKYSKTFTGYSLHLMKKQENNFLKHILHIYIHRDKDKIFTLNSFEHLKKINLFNIFKHKNNGKIDCY
jgi:hypothetical protein